MNILHRAGDALDTTIAKTREVTPSPSAVVNKAKGIIPDHDTREGMVIAAKASLGTAAYIRAMKKEDKNVVKAQKAMAKERRKSEKDLVKRLTVNNLKADKKEE